MAKAPRQSTPLQEEQRKLADALRRKFRSNSAVGDKLKELDEQWKLRTVSGGSDPEAEQAEQQQFREYFNDHFSHRAVAREFARELNLRNKKITDEPVEATATTAKPTPTKTWISAEAVRLKKANKILSNAYRRPTDFAKLLEKRMGKAAETDKSIRPVGWRHIKNMLPAWDLWPIESIKIS